MDKKDFNILGLKINALSEKKDISLVTGYNSYVQKVESILKTQKGEIPYYQNFGVDYYDYVFDNSISKILFESKAKNIISYFIKEAQEVLVRTTYYDNTVVKLSVDLTFNKQLKNQKIKCFIEVPLQ